MASYPKDSREALESPIVQGTWESLAYTFDFTNCGVTTITGQACVVTLDGLDVSGDVLSGTPTVSGLVLTTPKLGNLQDGKNYLMYGRVTHDGGQQTELFCRVIARA